MLGILFHKHLLSLVILAALGFGTQARIDHRIADIIAENVLHFGHNMGLDLAAVNDMENKVFSPLSLMTALSLVTLGAKGKTYHELKQVLGLDSDSELIQNPNKFHEQFGLMLNDLQHKNLNRDVIDSRLNANWRSTIYEGIPYGHNYFRNPVEQIIKVANGLFVQNGYSINLDYGQVLKSIYETEFTQLDFQLRNVEARNYINAWIKKATFGRIPEVIKDDIDGSTKVILASTLYFKAFWQTQFFDGATREDNFFPDGEHNPPIKAQMMATGGMFPFYDAKEYDCRIIGLPYRDNATTMYVIQPNYSTRQKLRNLQQVLDAHKINNIINNMKYVAANVIFPKMHFESRIYMKKTLENMNVHDIFFSQRSDLSLIAQIPQTGFVKHNVAQNRPSAIQLNSADVSFQSIYRTRPVYKSSQSGSSVLQDVASLALSNLESSRQKTDSYNPNLYLDDIIHSVDFSVDEQGTEAAAATHTLLRKTGPDVVFRGDTPFMFVIRHDPTKLPLFYGVINKPQL